MQDSTIYIKNYGSASYIGIRLVQNGILYIRYTSSYMIATAEQCKALTDKNLSCAIVKVFPRVLLAFLEFGKYNVKISNLFSFLLLYFLCFSHT